MYFGLEQLNYKRITEYMKIAELIIEEVLNSIIITFYNNEQEERLKAIIMAEGIFNNEMEMHYIFLTNQRFLFHPLIRCF